MTNGPQTHSWWPLAARRHTGEQLEDLESILNEPEPAQLEKRAVLTSPSPATHDALPLSRNSPFPRLASSPDKLDRQASGSVASSDAAGAQQPTTAAQSNIGSTWLNMPSIAAWLPSSAAASPAGKATPMAPAPFYTWAAQAQQQLSAACQATSQQLSAASGTAIGVSVLGAAVGGMVAGPLGVAVGAKSGAALVAAGALSGAAVKQFALGGIHPTVLPAAIKSGEEREMQPVSLSTAAAARQAQDATGESTVSG